MSAMTRLLVDVALPAGCAHGPTSYSDMEIRYRDCRPYKFPSSLTVITPQSPGSTVMSAEAAPKRALVKRPECAAPGSWQVVRTSSPRSLRAAHQRSAYRVRSGTTCGLSRRRSETLGREPPWTQSFVSMLTHWLFGLPPHQVRWVHVALALVMSSMVWGPPLARLYWHTRRERFLLRATPEQLRAYSQDPPKPPSLGGPAAMVLGAILAGTLLRGGPPMSVESASVAPASVVPSAPAQTQSTDPQTRTSTAPQDPRGMACFPPRESSQDEEEAKTCCKGTLRAGQPLQHADLRVRGEGDRTEQHDAVHRRRGPVPHRGGKRAR